MGKYSLPISNIINMFVSLFEKASALANKLNKNKNYCFSLVKVKG